MNLLEIQNDGLAEALYESHPFWRNVSFRKIETDEKFKVLKCFHDTLLDEQRSERIHLNRMSHEMAKDVFKILKDEARVFHAGPDAHDAKDIFILGWGDGLHMAFNDELIVKSCEDVVWTDQFEDKVLVENSPVFKLQTYLNIKDKECAIVVKNVRPSDNSYFDVLRMAFDSIGSKNAGWIVYMDRETLESFDRDVMEHGVGGCGWKYAEDGLSEYRIGKFTVRTCEELN